jgi:hypothetical protein
LFRPLEFIGLTQKRLSEFFDLGKVDIQLLASVFMRFLRRCVFVPKLMRPLVTKSARQARAVTRKNVSNKHTSEACAYRC